MRADLHMHSVWSDGAYPPAELAKRCKARGLGLFSVTDHDSMGGSEEGALAAKREGLSYLRGWEVSAYSGETKVHILGYGCGEGAEYLAFQHERVEGAITRAGDMLRKANAYFGLSITLSDVERFHRKKLAPIHTMDVVSAYAEALGADKGALYRDAFARDRAAFSVLCRPTPKEAIDIIHALGGVAVLAHPGRIEPSEREELLLSLPRMGLDGIECRYTTHTVTETEYFLAYAAKRGLIVTGGSDFHAEGGAPVLGEPCYFPDERLMRFVLPS